MAKRKKTVKRKPPKKVTTVTVIKKQAIGKPKQHTKTAGYYIKAAKDKLYTEMGSLMIQKEKASKKSVKRKIQKRISEKRQQINKLK